MPRYVNLDSGLVRDWFPVTPSDGADNLTVTANDTVVGFRATGAGNIVVTNSDNIDRTVAVTAGEYITFVGAKRVKATGTTATGIVSLLV